MKLIILILILTLLSCTANHTIKKGSDFNVYEEGTLVLKNGQEIQAQTIEMNDDEIKYLPKSFGTVEQKSVPVNDVRYYQVTDSNLLIGLIVGAGIGSILGSYTKTVNGEVVEGGPGEQVKKTLLYGAGGALLGVVLSDKDIYIFVD